MALSGGPFVGRDSERAALRAASERARAGEHTLVLLGGEAGIGKSRLVRGFADELDVPVLWGDCVELGPEGLSFAPFTAILRQLLRSAGRETFESWVPGGLGVLARVLPELGEVTTADPETVRTLLYDYVQLALEGYTGEQPLVLVVEDAHWADRGTRELLAFLARRMSATRLLVIVTYRTDELHRTHPLRPWLAEMGRLPIVERVQLAGLPRREVAELSESLMGREPSMSELDVIVERTDGNPLFIETLAGSTDDVAVPDSLRDLLVRGVERLPDETRSVLRVAAAGGRRVTHRLLLSVTELSEDALAEAVRPAVDARVILADEEGYAFRHALIHEAVHGDLLPGERTRLHTRFAEALDRDPSLVPAGRAALETAHHWYAAGDQTWALISAWQAAHDPRLGPTARLKLVERVLELWSRVADAGTHLGVDHVAVLEQAVRAASRAAYNKRALALSAEALEELGSDPDVGRRALLHSRRAELLLGQARPGWRAEMETARQLLVAEPDGPVKAQVWADIACHAEPEESVELARAAVAMAGDDEAVPGFDDVPVTLHVRITLASALIDAGAVDEAFAVLREAQSMDRAGGERFRHRIATTESDMLEKIGRSEDAARVARQGLAPAGSPPLSVKYGSLLAINESEPLVSLGRWAEAEAIASKALELEPPAEKATWLRWVLGLAALGHGDVATARRYSAASSATSRTLQTLDLLRAEIEFADGQPRQALELVLAAAREGRPAEEPRYGWPLLVTGVRAARSLQRNQGGRVIDDLEAELDELESAAGSLRVVGDAMPAWRATLFAELSAARGRLDVDLWEQALRAWQGLGRPMAISRALVGLAEARAEAGDRDEAAGLLRQAYEVVADLDVEPVRAEIDQMSRRVGTGPIGVAGSEAEDTIGLTPRELEVLRLVTAGRSNRQIADELFISSKTASVHVSNILAKLGVSGRGEAAAKAVRLRLFA